MDRRGRTAHVALPGDPGNISLGKRRIPILRQRVWCSAVQSEPSSMIRGQRMRALLFHHQST
ncbi:hypothetical protein J6590_043564 [Homalodisca vitripennis]|nr:hypothetical protein J6590_043564 [Homalodisca vitripennis]